MTRHYPLGGERGNYEGVQRETAMRGVDSSTYPGLQRRLPQRLHHDTCASGRQIQEQDVGVSLTLSILMVKMVVK